MSSLRVGTRARGRRAGSPASIVRILLAALLLVGAAFEPIPLGAQEATVRERQVPVDSARSISEIGPELRSDLGLFPDVDDFKVARLFVTDDGRRVLEVSYRVDGVLTRERRTLSPDALAALRRRVAARLAEAGAGPGPDPEPERPSADRTPGPEQEGRGRLVLGQTLLGLGFYGWAVPEVLDLEGDRGPVAAYLLTAGASFYLPYRLTRDVPVTDAHRHLTLWGGSRGILHGLLAARTATGREDHTERAHLATALATSVTGSWLGYRAADAAGLEAGTSVLWTTLADAGTLAGFGASYVSGFYDDVVEERTVEDPRTGEPVPVLEHREAHPRIADLTALALTGAGLATGRWMGGRDDYTVGDVSALRSMGLLGAQAALPLAELTVSSDDDRGKRYVAGMLAGGAAGIAAGSRLLRGRSLTSSQGLLLNAGHLAGGLGAVGLTWLAVGDDEGDELLYTAAAAVGSGLGLALTYRALDPPSGRERGQGLPWERRRSRAREGVQIDVTPAALLVGLAARDRRDRGPTVPPLLRIRF